MSFLPAPFGRRAYDDQDLNDRHPVVHINGSMEVAESRWAQFANAYAGYANNVARNAIHRAPRARYSFLTGDTMTVMSDGFRDHVVIEVVDIEDAATTSSSIEGFVVVPMKEGSPDRAQTELYAFDFDKTSFAFTVEPALLAGNHRRSDGDEKYVSWDGTGSGDMAIEPFPVITATSKNLQNPNAYAEPFSALSGKLYCDGVEYPVLDGIIYGMRVSGNDILIADFPDNRTLRVHRASIFRNGDSQDVQNIIYQSVLGTAPVLGVGPVNFNASMTGCVSMATVVIIAEPYAADRVFTTVQIATSQGEQIVRSGYKGDTVNFTLKRTTRVGTMSNFCPHNFTEYGLPWDNNPNAIVTTGDIDEIADYFDLEFAPNWATETPTWSGEYNRQRQCTVIKKPIIVFQGIYPTTVYTWMRTVSVETISDTNILYWYKDYDTGDYVRCNWSMGYVATQNYEEYGAFDPDISSVMSGRALNVGGNVLVGESGNWFYAVTNGKGDYILRQEPNGTLSDALLVSATGVKKRITNTYSVGII